MDLVIVEMQFFLTPKGQLSVEWTIENPGRFL